MRKFEEVVSDYASYMECYLKKGGRYQPPEKLFREIREIIMLTSSRTRRNAADRMLDSLNVVRSLKESISVMDESHFKDA